MQCSDESEPLLTLQERSDLINAEFTPPFISCDPKLLSIFVVAFDTRAGDFPTIFKWICNSDENYSVYLLYFIRECGGMEVPRKLLPHRGRV